MNVAIIVAAGSGTRFGGDRPKQFLEIHGKPLLIHTLEKFQNCPEIDEIVLVLSPTEIVNFPENLGKFDLPKLQLTLAGGKTRAESVFRGLKGAERLHTLENRKKIEIVAVHDGARPFVSSEEISATIEKARETGAACLVAAVTDTIKEVANGTIVGTIDRTKLRRALTPQAFRFEVLQKAFANADLSEAATDECFLVERTGQKIATVEGSAKNIKITTREDWELAQVFLKAGIGV